jgi:hypothetical protein
MGARHPAAVKEIAGRNTDDFRAGLSCGGLAFFFTRGVYMV